MYACLPNGIHCPGSRCVVHAFKDPVNLTIRPPTNPSMETDIFRISFLILFEFIETKCIP